MTTLKIYTDGGCSPENKPKMPAYMAYVMFIEDKDVLSGSILTSGTNNIAEYGAINFALNHLNVYKKDIPFFDNIEFISDSKLVVNQLMSKWKCKNDTLIALNTLIRQRLTSLNIPVTFTHVRREHNKISDLLCNLVKIDKQKGKPLQSLSEFKKEHNLTRYKALKGF